MKQIQMGQTDSFPSTEGYWLDTADNRIYFAVMVKTGEGGNKIVLYGDTYHTDLEPFLDGIVPLERDIDTFPRGSKFQKLLLSPPKS